MSLRLAGGGPPSGRPDGRAGGERVASGRLTQTRDALDPEPLLYSGALNDPRHPIYTDYGFNASPRADFVGGSYDAAGTFWAGVVKQLGAPGSNGEVATTGYVGRLDFGGGFSGAPAAPATPAPRCVDRRKFTFRVHQPRHGRVVSAIVYVDGRRIKRLRAHRIARIVLRRLPPGVFTVKIVATTNRHSRTVSVRRYRGCTKSRPHTLVHHAGGRAG